jgi:tRNA modification GTPase
VSALTPNAEHSTTIAAVATAPGRGGVGIIRVSGPLCEVVAKHLIGFTPKPRHAHYCDFRHADGTTIDSGIALYFPCPNSFTGEDVLELQGHGGPVVLDMLISQVLQYGVRNARPGEFSERAFLNDKLDLAQAEAIADLIDASSQQAAKNALNSLKGDFSRKIDQLLDQLIHLRIFVESAIDFPEEEIDFLSDGKIQAQLNSIIQQTDNVLHQARQGVLLREGMNVVIAGRPNAGKSSLLNALSQRDLAIVTDIAGTTRDVLRQHIQIDGLPLHIIDTAGLRDNPDHIEEMGIARAWEEIDKADRILLMIDSTDTAQLNAKNHWPEFFNNKKYLAKLTLIYNKIDQSGFSIENRSEHYEQLAISALSGIGLHALKQHLKKTMGFNGNTEGGFSARRRHIRSIEEAQDALLKGKIQLETAAAGELLAEDLRQAQEHLSEITGSFTSDDLLGKIFSSFCIGK